MPTFANREALSSVRAKLNSAIERIDAYGVPSILSYSTLAQFQAAVTAGLTMADGLPVVAAGEVYVADSTAVISGLPAGWRNAGYVYTYAQVEAWATAFQAGSQYIIVNDGGYYVAYERDPTGAATDLTTALGEAFIKRGVNADDFATLAADLATTLGSVYTTNANGSSVKFPDGTMICTKVLTGQGPISSASGSLFSSAPIAIGTLPATFVGVPIRHTMIASGTSAAAWHQDIAPPTTTDGGNIGLLRATTSALTTYEVHCTFTGRWA